MKILLLGGSGMLGSDCQKVLSADHEVFAPDRKELDIVSWDVVIEKMQNNSPDIVLNCAGFTDVDACERKDYFDVRKINVEGPRNLAQGAARFNCKIMHISSDYVYSGQKSVPQPYFEDDPLNPVSSYGKSKMESEIAIRENAPNYIIIRSSWLYGFTGKNFLKSILINALDKKRKTLRAVSDQVGSPTWTYSLALQIKELLGKNTIGTFHATSEGYCSRFECAQYVLKKLKIKALFETASMRDYPHAAKKPTNCILENRLLKKQGFNVMADWKEDIDTFLDQYGQDLIKQIKAGNH